MSDDNEVFYWQHSYSRVFTPESSYSPSDGFMSFEHYNVEIRDRVKCISASEGFLFCTFHNCTQRVKKQTRDVFANNSNASRPVSVICDTEYSFKLQSKLYFITITVS